MDFALACIAKALRHIGIAALLTAA